MKEFLSKQRILIVDDMPANIAILGEAFSPDYEVLVATTGERALDLASRTPLPDLVLLDIVMPGMDGFQVCRRLKENGKTKNIPVVFITSKGESTDEEKGLSLGAADYVTKPFHLPVVKARVKTHLDLKRKTDLLELLASRDGLTGLPNRRSFDERFDIEWRRALRESSTLGLLLMDIDDFKRFNDHYGHSAGDDCLCAVSQCIASSLKRAGDFAARYGGEEFAALVPITTLRELQFVGEGIRKAVEGKRIPHAFSRTAPCVTLSIGGACCEPAYESDPRTFVDFADALLYRAKSAGRNTVVCEPAKLLSTTVPPEGSSPSPDRG